MRLLKCFVLMTMCSKTIRLRSLVQSFVRKTQLSSKQSHYREVPGWEIFMEQELRFGLDMGRFGNF